MKLRQMRSVTIRGPGQEKTTRFFYESVFIGVFILSLFLTGCSGSLVGSSPPKVPDHRVTLGQDTSVPPLSDLSIQKESVPDRQQLDKPKADVGLFKSFIEQEAVAERVRSVVGWLRFVRQEKTATLISEGWERVSAGRLVGAIDSRPVADRPNLSVPELMLWRQLLAGGMAEDLLESMAIILTTASTPDDVLHADVLFFSSDTYAKY